MKIWLDDLRDAPDGWVRTYWPEEVIHLLQHHEVETISLDHDLGEDERNGYDVILWIEEAVFTRNFRPPNILVHSANTSARMKMESGIKSIRNKTNEN